MILQENYDFNSSGVFALYYLISIAKGEHPEINPSNIDDEILKNHVTLIQFLRNNSKELVLNYTHNK